jgi:Phage capsid family
MSTDYELKRSISDVQSKIASIDRRLLGMSAGEAGMPPPGRAFFALAMAALHRQRGEYETADSLLQRAATSPAMTTVATWAAELTQSPVGGLLLAIVKQSAYAALASRTQAFVIEGEGLPKVVVGGEINAAWIAEGSPANVFKGSLAALSLTPKKLVSIAVMTEELLSYGINTAATLRTLMSNGIASALDAAFFSTSAATSSTPAGILNGVSATTASAATPAEAAAVADLRALLLALTSPSDVVFVTTPARALALSTIMPAGWPYPVLSSNALPAARVICVDASGLIAAHSTVPRFSASTEATLHEEDTTPLALGSGAQGSGVLATPMRSTFQTDVVAVRAILWAAWAVRSGGVAYLDASGW